MLFIALGAGCGLIVGGLLAVAFALLSGTALFRDSGLGLMIGLAMFGLGGACYGFQAYQETPAEDADT
jgi:hypothetical protein